MDLQLLIAQWSGQLPPVIVPHAVLRQEPPRCVQPRCVRPASVKGNGEYALSCRPCLERRARSCKRRRAALMAEGGCRRCAYRKRTEGDFLCERSRTDRDRQREQQRRDALDASAISASRRYQAIALTIFLRILSSAATALGTCFDARFLAISGDPTGPYEARLMSGDGRQDCGRMTYDLRRMRLRGLVDVIAPDPRSRAPPPMSGGFEAPPRPTDRLNRAIDSFDREVQRLWERHGLAA